MAPVFQLYVTPPFPVNVADEPEHIVAFATVTFGKEFTVTVAVVLAVHVPTVPVTEYTVVVVGETLTDEVVAPVFHV